MTRPHPGFSRVALRIGLMALFITGMGTSAFLKMITAQPLRIELPAEPNSAPYQVIPAGRSGLLLLFRTTDSLSRTADTWLIRLYDTRLSEKWSRTVKTGEGFIYRDHIRLGDTLVLAFTDQQDSRETKSQLITTDLGLASVSSKAFTLPAKSEIVKMLHVGNLVYIASTDKAKATTVTRIDLRNGNSGTTAILEGKESHPADLYFHPPDSALYLAVRHQEPKGVGRMTLFRMSGNLEITGRIEAGEEAGPALMSAGIAAGDSGYILIMGNYVADTKQKASSGDRSTNFKASGLYAARISDGECNVLKYHQFFEFNNFFDYLTYEDINRMKKRKNETVTIDFGVISHPLVNTNGSFVILSEAYYPKYQYVTRTEYDFYGMPYPYSYSIFEGYQYTNAFIAGFDSLGNKIWDNNFEIRDMLSQDLRKRLNLLFEGSEVVMAYNNEGMVASQVINGNQLTGEFEYSRIEPLYQGDQASENRYGDVVYWYDNFMVCFGYQKVSNPAKGEN
jgi:hypothetical protein